MANYLLDTDCLIDYLRGHQAVVQLVKDLQAGGHNLGLCCVNVAEVYAGLKPRVNPEVEQFLEKLAYWELTRECGKLAGEYRFHFARRGVSIATPDALVAAASIVVGATLVTRNISHYPMEGLSVLTGPR